MGQAFPQITRFLRRLKGVRGVVRTAVLQEVELPLDRIFHRQAA